MRLYIRAMQQPKGQDVPRFLTPRLLLIIFFSAIFVTIAWVGGADFYKSHLEYTRPIVKLIEAPRGVGFAPVSLKFELIDTGAGLDQVLIRTRQKDKVKEVLRKGLQGLESARVSVEFPGDKSALEEGAAEIEVQVSDRSFWKNTKTQYFSLKVDFSKPAVEVLSSSHKTHHGGSQVLFYRARDEDLALSGVKVGGHTFIGFPARGIDREIDDPSLFVVLYAVDLRSSLPELTVRVFAEDQVGNATSVSFLNEIEPFPRKKYSVELTDDILRGSVANLADQNYQRIRDELAKVGEDFEYKSPKGSKERTLEKFVMVNGTLRSLNEVSLINYLKGPRFESYWTAPFLRPEGIVDRSFGDEISFLNQGQMIGQETVLAYTFSPPRDQREVHVSNDGIVIFSDNIGVFGRCVGIDHGLGLVSIYGHLEQVIVNKGSAVTRGQKLGIAGTSGLSQNPNLYFELRVHGVPVNPAEWWDEGWYYTQVISKITELKHKLGMRVYRPLE